MASIGKFALSALSAQQEVSIGLAHGHFDFSLIKLEAPAEYQALGRHLSSKRRVEAEEGMVHATARKLGSLFADDLPKVPALKRAYGLRTSEIAENPAFNPSGKASDGPLGRLIGADGTSIWAAATSGPGALEVHLLACMLARCFSGEEATAVWDELVRARRTVLLQRLGEETFPASTLSLAKVEIRRDMLATWDASARSWIRTADGAMRLRQTQLLHIIENLGLTTSSLSGVYETVMKVWYEALSVVNRLIEGVGQLVTEPQVLIGLSAWHIYPNMSVHCDRPTFVSQKDPLVAQGGVLTVGIQNLNPKSKGITWSVQLQHLKFYGKSTSATAAINSTSTRILFEHLVQMAMGSAMASWGSEFGDLARTSPFFIALANQRSKEISYNNTKTGIMTGVEDPRIFQWVTIFGQQAQLFQSASASEKQKILRRVEFGRRRCSSFLTVHPALVPRAFGFGSYERILSMLSDVEEQLALLRRIAAT
ncbi:hypothetical protein EDB81DRAFT_202931 [Dactylonectria macrodidyma]|uniref:Uncharacterized protein n=1 Tax=Dactylonectria macrodidyma TaxID=307937 RepID=A0A9P9DVX3_9HYPO|nr:hypothetical protein EDB81DRAFT_202931 [Dactylonectria macrodidyma]